MIKNQMNKAYLQINLIFFVFISLIFVYSVVFAATGIYPLKSACKDFPELCISKGLSRAFSQILSGNYEKALQLNIYSLKVFTFFVLQWLFRLIFGFFYFKFQQKQIIQIDIFISLLIFIYAFAPFFAKIYNALC